MKASYETPELVDHGSITARTFLITVGHSQATKGGVAFMTMPKIALVRAIVLNHAYHHRGQLSVYLRLIDVPVPSIYGPSADENPFAVAAQA